MKSMEIIAHTTGGEIKSAVEQVTERDYENAKAGLRRHLDGPNVEFNTDEGCVIIPVSQVLYIEIKLY